MSPDIQRICEVIELWLSARLDAAQSAWVSERKNVIQSGDKKALFLAFGMTPRKVGKADLALTIDEAAMAVSVRRYWNPQGWSIDQLVRVLFVLAYPSQDADAYVAILDQLFSTGEVGELVALYQALPLLPNPASHVMRAAEGIRTNIKAVFCAVAHYNPFPAEQFNDEQWNQMVLKCQFILVPMSPIFGLDRRANAALAAMVCDFIHERWAAKRPVAPEMWRCVGRFADTRALADLKLVLTTGTQVEKQAAALALSECPWPDAKQILDSDPYLALKVAHGTISWDSIDESD